MAIDFMPSRSRILRAVGSAWLGGERGAIVSKQTVNGGQFIVIHYLFMPGLLRTPDVGVGEMPRFVSAIHRAATAVAPKPVMVLVQQRIGDVADDKQCFWGQTAERSPVWGPAAEPVGMEGYQP